MACPAAGAAARAPAPAAGVAHRAALRRRDPASLRVARSLVPLAVLWIGKLIVDEVVQAIGTAAGRGAVDWTRLAELLALELAIALVGEGLARGLGPAREPARRPLRQPRPASSSCATRPRSTSSSSRTPSSTTSSSGRGARRWAGSVSSPCCWPRCRTRSRSPRSPRRSRSTSPGCWCCWWWRCCPRSWARPTSPRWAIRCSTRGRPSGASSTTCATSAPATSRPRSSSSSACRTSWWTATTG